MPYKINDRCVACEACVDQCPMSAITQGEYIYKIDKESCIDCGACVSVFPSDAIVEE